MAKDPDIFRAAEAALWASCGLEPTDVWIRLGGGENVRVQIIGNGPPVLFLHGGSTSGVNWAPLVAGMTDWKCLVVDRPGCGLSDAVAGGARPKRFSEFEAFADRLVADLLDGLEVERAHLLSTSYGSYFAMRGAAAHPDRVDRIVEIAWPMGAPAEYVPMSMRLAAIPGLGAMTTRIPPTRRAVRIILKQLGLGPALDSGKISNEFIEWFLASLRHTDTMINELRANPKVITPIAGVNDRMLLQPELLARITAPVYFIWGEDDPLGGAAVAEEFAAQINDAEIEVLASTGHAPWIDEPELCATMATRFLSADRST